MTDVCSFIEQDARHRAAAKENSRNPSGKLIVAKGRNFATR